MLGHSYINDEYGKKNLLKMQSAYWKEKLDETGAKLEHTPQKFQPIWTL
jgi:hypothetical protein